MAVVAYQRRTAILRYVFTYGMHHNATLWTDLHVLSICDCVEKLEVDSSRVRQPFFQPYEDIRFRRVAPWWSVSGIERTEVVWSVDSNRSSLPSNLAGSSACRENTVSLRVRVDNAYLKFMNGIGVEELVGNEIRPMRTQLFQVIDPNQ